MRLEKEIKATVAGIFGKEWTRRTSEEIPATYELGLDNDAVSLDAVVLSADLSGSTNLVRNNRSIFAAEIYKIFLRCTVKIIRAEGGKASICDGDRVMGIYTGDSKNTAAVKTALKINYAKNMIINPAIREHHPDTTYQLQHRVGIDASELFVIRSGMRQIADLIWLGAAVNNAARLSQMAGATATRITLPVYRRLHQNLRYEAGRVNWERTGWFEGGQTIFASNSTMAIEETHE